MATVANEPACNEGQCVRLKPGTQAKFGDLEIGIMNCTSEACRLSIAPTVADGREIVFMGRTGDQITIGTTKFTVKDLSEDGVELELRD